MEKKSAGYFVLTAIPHIMFTRMKKEAKIYVAGHRGLAGSAIVRALNKAGYQHLVVRTREELDLLDVSAVEHFFAHQKPEYVFLAAAKVGGIMTNSNEPVEFLSENILVQQNVIGNAHHYGAEKLLFLGSSCIYPRLAKQPIKEEYFMTGVLEETNKAYAIAKIAGIELCNAYRKEYGANFISVMPTNLFGPFDRFDTERGHVLPALIKRFDDAKRARTPEVVLWGTGTPKREFLHADDLGEACVFLMETYDSGDIVNIGMGKDVSIKELAEMIRDITGYTGAIRWDTNKPDGTPRKLLDVSKINALGWRNRLELPEALRSTYEWYCREVVR
jgi:GDP-L-fucose synthase